MLLERNAIDSIAIFSQCTFFKTMTTFSHNWSNEISSNFAQICVIAVAIGKT